MSLFETWGRCSNPQPRGAFGDSVPPIFCASPNFVVPKKILFLRISYKQNLSPLKVYFTPQTLKPGYGLAVPSYHPAVENCSFTFPCFVQHTIEIANHDLSDAPIFQVNFH